MMMLTNTILTQSNKSNLLNIFTASLIIPDKQFAISADNELETENYFFFLLFRTVDTADSKNIRQIRSDSHDKLEM